MKVVAIVGTYRRGRTIDTAVEEALRGAADSGAQTEKIMLLDKHIEFCTNCRACTQNPGPQHGLCGIRDDMAGIIDTLESADAVILACPINFYSVTALMKRFIERLVCFAYWPWDTYPKNRLPRGRKKALLITASACPAFLGRVAFRGTFSVLAAAAQCLGAGDIRRLYFGLSARRPESTLDDKSKRRAYLAGQKLTR